MKYNRTELNARYDARKSFYGKAEIEYTDESVILYSYGTKIMEIKNNGEIKKHYPYSSNTTDRHKREFLKQYAGMSAKSLKELNAFMQSL